MTSELNTFIVWVVDDEAGMCIGAKRALQEYTAQFPDLDASVTYDVSTMESGELFLDRLKSESPDILLLDGKLPGIDGIDILEQLFSRNSPILTIMITAYATLENAIKATKLGAFDFLAKPFTPDELRYSLRKASRDLLLTRQAQKLAQQKKEIRFEFISILAHELKSPLNAIEGYVDLIKGNETVTDPADIRQMMERIGIRIGGMRKLIADLLDLTSLESGKRKRVIQECNLSTIATKVVENNSAEALHRSLTLRLDASTPCLMSVDPVEIEMLFNNLVTNAIKYNRPGGCVDVTLTDCGTSYRADVKDTGIGMSKEEQELLFKEFSRIKNNQTRGIEGSGLGLSIIQKIVHQYRGTITVSSEPGVGTLFTVIFPKN